MISWKLWAGLASDPPREILAGEWTHPTHDRSHVERIAAKSFIWFRIEEVRTKDVLIVSQEFEKYQPKDGK